MKIKPCFSSVLAILAVFSAFIAGSASYAAENGVTRVLVLKVVGDIPDDAGAGFVAAISGKFARYPTMLMMPVPDQDPLDIMLDAGCEDLDKQCLVMIGKANGVDAVLYTTVANVAGQFRVSFRYVDIATSTLASVDRGSAPGDEPAAFVALSLEDVIGPEPAPIVPDVMVNFVSYPPGSEVYVNSEFVGIAPVSASLKPGRYEVRYSRDGYQPRTEPLTVDPSRQNTFRLSMVAAAPVAPAPAAASAPAPAAAAVAPAPAPAGAAVVPAPAAPFGEPIPAEPVAEVSREPFYRTWWFWTIVGIAVVGAGTVAGVVAAQDDAPGGKVGFSSDSSYAPLDVTLYR